MRAALVEHDLGASMMQATSAHDIPYSTFWDWCYGMRKSRKRGIQGVFTTEEEEQLVQYLLIMCERGLV